MKLPSEKQNSPLQGIVHVDFVEISNLIKRKLSHGGELAHITET